MTTTEGARIYLDFLEKQTKEGLTLLPFPPHQNQEKSELALFGTLFFTLSGPGGLPGKLTAETFTLKEAELKKQPQLKASWSLDALQSSLRALNPLAWAEGDRSVVSSLAYLQAP